MKIIDLTSEITDKVSFCRQDHHLHLCPQMKQVWWSALLKDTSRIRTHFFWLPVHSSSHYTKRLLNLRGARLIPVFWTTWIDLRETNPDSFAKSWQWNCQSWIKVEVQWSNPYRKLIFTVPWNTHLKLSRWHGCRYPTFVQMRGKTPQSFSTHTRVVTSKKQCRPCLITGSASLAMLYMEE